MTPRTRGYYDPSCISESLYQLLLLYNTLKVIESTPEQFLLAHPDAFMECSFIASSSIVSCPSKTNTSLFLNAFK